jgi:hypothetical protein
MNPEISKLLERESLYPNEQRKLYEHVKDEYKSMKTEDLIKAAVLLKDWADIKIHQFLAKKRDRAESYRYLAEEYKRKANSLTNHSSDYYKNLIKDSNEAEAEAERIEKLQAEVIEADEHNDKEGGYKKRKSNRKHPSKRPHNRKQHKHKWSLKYKRSIDCKHPKGFSQRQHCKYGRKNMRKLTRKK